ncbi:hypothetical protein F5Y18DRAFT_350062 [Xylariaceae sp. FL1019]|nr:hypothetical protein F5Y18DRAFT_350062 [Xylariaceae sp. FL1019]
MPPSTKSNLASEDASRHQLQDELPAYTAVASSSELSATYPSPDSPFNFPPAYTGPSSFSPPSEKKQSIHPGPTLIAIPQLTPQPTSPFLSSYTTLLLSSGIPHASFTSFLTTLSAFLSASVSSRALLHAQDVGKHVTSVPTKFSKDTAAHFKSVGKSLSTSAKSGNVIGLATGVVGGAIGLTVGTAARAVGSIASLPATTFGVAAKKPLTPRQRAEAYLSVAENDWFTARGLSARFFETGELVELLKVVRPMGNHGDMTGERLVDLSRRTAVRGAEEQISALEREFGITKLEVDGNSKPLDIGTQTLWLVLTDLEREKLDELMR